MLIVRLFIVAEVAFVSLASDAPDFTGDQQAQGDADLAVLDFSKFVGDDVLQQQEFVDELRGKLTSSGVFYLKNHGIDEQLYKDVLKEANPFFTLPAEQKAAYTMNNDVDLFDGYEPFQTTALYGELNNSEGYSFNISHLRESVESSPFQGMKFYELGMEKWRVLLQLMRAYALAAGIDENFFVEKHELREGAQTMSNVRINHYPAMDPGAGDQRFGPHADYMTLAILYQEEPGLEVWDHEAKIWRQVTPKTGTLVVNTGNMMQMWTNNLFPAAVHRVRVYDEFRDQTRYSVLVFMGARGDVVLDAKDVFPDQESTFQPISALAHIQDRMGAFRRGDKDRTKETEVKFAPLEALNDGKAADGIKSEL